MARYVEGAERAKDVLKHVVALDGVRGTAIALVLVFHLLWSNSQTGSRVMNLVVGFRRAGWVGVDLFFALSGFLITGILFDSLGDAHYFKNFYVRRVLRIMPLYYGVITALYVFLRIHSNAAGLGRPYGLLLAYLNNTPLWWGSWMGRPLIDLTNHLWSLAVEEQFYLVWPLVIFAVRDRRRLMWVALGLAAMAPVSRALMLVHGAGFDATYKMTNCRADSLLGGAWLALAMRGGMKERVQRWAPWGLAAGLAACAAIAWWTGNFDFEANRQVNMIGFSLVALASTSWLALALRAGGVVKSLMSANWLRFLGKYSYGIYVLHMPVAALVARFLMGAVRAQVHSKALMHVVELVLDLGATIPLAMLSFALYESPFLRLKRYFNYERSRGAALV